MSRYADDDMVHVFSASQMRTLESVRRRLYAQPPLSGNERGRDLANTLDALMHSAITINERDITNA